mmetsp:Transcript_18894/g.35653  ORF Transcript_18894/g.35653 Transcript_18894/m.35653 type:complete len:339 (-) Transcript_18894:339-1355(-)
MNQAAQANVQKRATAEPTHDAKKKLSERKKNLGLSARGKKKAKVHQPPKKKIELDFSKPQMTLGNPLEETKSPNKSGSSSDHKKDTEKFSTKKIAFMLMGATAKQSGEQLKARYSELLLNLTVVGSILAAFAYDAFESQTEIVTERPLERYFVSFCILSVLANLLAIVFSLYLWDKVTLVDDENMMILVKHYKTILRTPRWMIMIGGVFFMILIFMQGHLDYGDYVDVEFAIIYTIAILVAIGFFVWSRRVEAAFRDELLAEMDRKNALKMSTKITTGSPVVKLRTEPQTMLTVKEEQVAPQQGTSQQQVASQQSISQRQVLQQRTDRAVDEIAGSGL